MVFSIIPLHHFMDKDKFSFIVWVKQVFALGWRRINILLFTRWRLPYCRLTLWWVGPTHSRSPRSTHGALARRRVAAFLEQQLDPCDRPSGLGGGTNDLLTDKSIRWKSFPRIRNINNMIYILHRRWYGAPKHTQLHTHHHQTKKRRWFQA